MSSPTNKATKQGKRSYEKLSSEFVLEHLMGYYEAPSGHSFRRYCMLHGIFRKRQALQYTAGKIGLEALKKDNVPPSFVTEKIALHLNMRKEAAIAQRRRIAMENRVLTNDETALIVSSCRELSVMGLGIDEDTCLTVANSILEERIDKKDFVPVTRGVVRRVITNNKELLTLMKGNSIDPKRARQADESVMEALFVKLENYVKILHNQGKVPWASASDIPAKNQSNMDEIATNSHSHRKKIIADKLRLGRLFQEANAGDSKMPMHISMCITSKPCGELGYKKFFICYG